MLEVNGSSVDFDKGVGAQVKLIGDDTGGLADKIRKFLEVCNINVTGGGIEVQFEDAEKIFIQPQPNSKIDLVSATSPDIYFGSSYDKRIDIVHNRISYTFMYDHYREAKE